MTPRQLMTRYEFEVWLRATAVHVVVTPYSVVCCTCGDLNCHGWRLVAPPRPN